MLPLADYLHTTTLDPWHTWSWVAEVSEPFDWFQDRRGCTVGFPTGAGDAVRRCQGSGRFGGTTLNATRSRPPDRQERGLKPLGRWREATVAEVIPSHSAPLIQTGAALHFGQRMFARVALRDPPEVVAFEYGSCGSGNCGASDGWWIDWRAPPDLDGTSILAGHAAGDQRYDAAYAGWSAAVLDKVRAIEAGELPTPAPQLAAEGLPATRLTAVLPISLWGDDDYAYIRTWYHEIPLDTFEAGYLTRREFESLGIALDVSVRGQFVSVEPVDLDPQCRVPEEYRPRPWWPFKLQPCNEGDVTWSLRMPVRREGERVAMATLSTETTAAFGRHDFWKDDIFHRIRLDLSGEDPAPGPLAYAGRDPVFVGVSATPIGPPTVPSSATHLWLPTRVWLDPAAGVSLGPREWEVWLTGRAETTDRLELGVSGGVAPPRVGDALDAILTTDVEAAGTATATWALPSDLPRPPRWAVLRWTRAGVVLAVETVALEPPTKKRQPLSCASVVYWGPSISLRKPICPPMAVAGG